MGGDGEVAQGFPNEAEGFISGLDQRWGSGV